MNNSDVAHQWAAQSRRSGHGSNFWFEGPTIYSYGRHFHIATFTDRHDRDGRQIVLFTTRRYSMTTARHISLARYALHGLPVRVVMVPEVCGFGPGTLRDMAEEYGRALLRAARARVNAAAYIAEAEHIADNIACLAEAFGYTAPTLPAINDQTLREAKEAARRIAEEAARRAAERAAQRDAHYAEAIARWRNGEAVQLWQYADKPTALRLSADGMHVETSRGASVTLRTARILWRALRAVRGAGDADRRALVDRMRSIDGYTLREVRDDGTVIIGCHTLRAAEIDKFAEARGWTGALAAA